MCIHTHTHICIYICHIFSIHSSIHGHLSCFYTPIIVNSATMNIVVHASFKIEFFRYIARAGLLAVCYCCSVTVSLTI